MLIGGGVVGGHRERRMFRFAVYRRTNNVSLAVMARHASNSSRARSVYASRVAISDRAHPDLHRREQVGDRWDGSYFLGFHSHVLI